MGKIILFNYKLKIINNLWKLLSITYSLKFFLFYNESLHACNDLLNHELSIYIEILQLHIQYILLQSYVFIVLEKLICNNSHDSSCELIIQGKFHFTTVLSPRFTRKNND